MTKETKDEEFYDAMIRRSSSLFDLEGVLGKKPKNPPSTTKKPIDPPSETKNQEVKNKIFQARVNYSRTLYPLGQKSLPESVGQRIINGKEDPSDSEKVSSLNRSLPTPKAESNTASLRSSGSLPGSDLNGDGNKIFSPVTPSSLLDLSPPNSLTTGFLGSPREEPKSFIKKAIGSFIKNDSISLNSVSGIEEQSLTSKKKAFIILYGEDSKNSILRKTGRAKIKKYKREGFEVYKINISDQDFLKSRPEEQEIKNLEGELKAVEEKITEVSKTLKSKFSEDLKNELVNLIEKQTSISQKLNDLENRTDTLDYVTEKLEALAGQEGSVLSFNHLSADPDLDNNQNQNLYSGAFTGQVLAKLFKTKKCKGMEIEYGCSYGAKPKSFGNDRGKENAHEFFKALHQEGVEAFVGKAYVENAFTLLEGPEDIKTELDELGDLIKTYNSNQEELTKEIETLEKNLARLSSSENINNETIGNKEEAIKDVVSKREKLQSELNELNELKEQAEKKLEIIKQVTATLPEGPKLQSGDPLIKIDSQQGKSHYLSPELINPEDGGFIYTAYYLAGKKTEKSEVQKTTQKEKIESFKTAISKHERNGRGHQLFSKKISAVVNGSSINKNKGKRKI